MNTDLNRLYDLTSPLPLHQAAGGEEARRARLRSYFHRALYYVEEMAKADNERARLNAETSALYALMIAGEIAQEIYDRHALPRCQEANRSLQRGGLGPLDTVEAYEDRLDLEGYSS